jgi:hypothetical protein
VKLCMFIIICVLFSTNAQARHHHYHQLHHRSMTSDQGVVAHPDGCPRTLFCACGASVRIFGHAIPALFKASTWFKFPRTSPAPGMVAVASHHVWVLESHLEGDTWIGYDANSGGHLTRIHPHRLAGYTVVNPHG